jgi:hypothetical protein
VVHLVTRGGRYRRKRATHTSIAEARLEEIALLFVISISEIDSRNAEATRFGTAFPLPCSALRYMEAVTSSILVSDAADILDFPRSS